MGQNQSSPSLLTRVRRALKTYAGLKTEYHTHLLLESDLKVDHNLRKNGHHRSYECCR